MQPGARIAFFGATAGNIPEIDARAIFWKQVQILGTTMGTQAEFAAMIDFVTQYQIIPVIDEVFSIANAKQAFEKMGAAKQFGKLVITV